MPLRILMASLYPSAPEHVGGGIEAVTAVLAPALAAEPRLELHIAAFNRGLRHPFDDTHGRLHVHWLPTSARLSTARLLSVDAFHLLRLIRKLRPDVLHAQAPSALPVAALCCSLPLVVTVHGLEMFNARLRRTRMFSGPVGNARRVLGVVLMTVALRRGDALVSISPYVERVLATRARTRRRALIENPVHGAFFDVAAEPVSPSKAIVCIGQLTELKDQVGVVQAFGRVAQTHPSWQLVLVGQSVDAAYAARLQRTIEHVGVCGRVTLAGPATLSEVAEHYRRSAALIHGSVHEVAPMVISQAMAAGRPVIATAVGGVPWLVRPGLTGSLVPPSDTTAMADALEALCANEHARRAMGSNAREDARRRFTAARIARRTADLYEQVV